MQARQINRISLNVSIFLSLAALLAVISGYFQAPQLDEGSAAHIFQFSIVLLALTVPVFLFTADWKQLWQTARKLIVPAVALLLALALLYYLEHYFYVQHFFQ